MNIIEILKRTLTEDYFNFSSRANRTEWWILKLFCIGLFALTALGLEIVEMLFANNIGSFIVSIANFLVGIIDFAMFIPMLSTTVRRLHDSGKSGWWIIGFGIPLVNIYVIYLVWFKSGSYGYNEYGPQPE